MQRVVYAFILIIILASLGGFPNYLAVGQGGGSQNVTVTVIATPVYSPPTGGGEEGELPAPLMVTTISVTGLAATVPLQVDAQGIVQASTQLTTADGKLSLYIARGSKLLDAQGNPFTSLSAARMSSPPAPPEAALILAYNLGPDGTTFSPPIILTIQYDPAALPEGVAKADLYIAYWDGSRWVALETTVNTEANTVSCKINHFTIFGIIAPTAAPAPAAFQISSLGISPTKVDIGETVNVTVLVANTGGQSGNYLVILKINGVVEADREVALDAGASKQSSFSIARDTAGTYSVDVNGLTGAFEVKQPVKPISWWLIGGIIAAVVAMAFAIFLLRRRMLF